MLVDVGNTTVNTKFIDCIESKGVCGAFGSVISRVIIYFHGSERTVVEILDSQEVTIRGDENSEDFNQRREKIRMEMEKMAKDWRLDFTKKHQDCH